MIFSIKKKKYLCAFGILSRSTETNLESVWLLPTQARAKVCVLTWNKITKNKKKMLNPFYFYLPQLSYFSISINNIENKNRIIINFRVHNEKKNWFHNWQKVPKPLYCSNDCHINYFSCVVVQLFFFRLLFLNALEI